MAELKSVIELRKECEELRVALSTVWAEVNSKSNQIVELRDPVIEHEADAAVKICDMAGVREHGEGAIVELWRNGRGRLVIVAYNECGNNTTEVDLWDIVDWLFDGKGQSGVAEVIRQGEEK